MVDQRLLSTHSDHLRGILQGEEVSSRWILKGKVRQTVRRHRWQLMIAQLVVTISQLLTKIFERFRGWC